MGSSRSTLSTTRCPAKRRRSSAMRSWHAALAAVAAKTAGSMPMGAASTRATCGGALPAAVLLPTLDRCTAVGMARASGRQRATADKKCAT